MSTGTQIIPFPTLRGGERFKSADAPVTFQDFSIGEDDAGIVDTVAYMNGLAIGDQGAGSPIIQNMARMVVASCAASDAKCEREAVFYYVKNNIAFRNEDGELLQTPLATLQDFHAGDCDDHSMLIAAMLMALGHQVQFRTVGVDGDPTFVHVYPMDYDASSGAWVALDTTVAESYPGWESPRITRVQDHGVITSEIGNQNQNFRMEGIRRAGRLQGLGDTNCGDGFFYDSDGNCQPINAVTDIQTLAQTAQPFALPFVNAAAYRMACNAAGSGFIDPNCTYNPNPAPFLNTGLPPVSSRSLTNLSSSTIFLGLALLGGLAIVFRRPARR